jgi:hypothetical protein
MLTAQIGFEDSGIDAVVSQLNSQAWRRMCGWIFISKPSAL